MFSSRLREDSVGTSPNDKNDDDGEEVEEGGEEEEEEEEEEDVIGRADEEACPADVGFGVETESPDKEDRGSFSAITKKLE